MTEKASCLEDLELNYKNPHHPISFAGISKIQRYYNGILSVSDIEKFLSTKDFYITHREVKKPSPRNPTYAYSIRTQIQVDLCQISNIKRHNNNYSWMLCAIDTFSRKAFIRLMRTKTADETLSSLKSILQEAKKMPKSIAADRGSEIKNRKVAEFCGNNNIKLIFCDTYKSAAIVERFQLSIQRRIYKWMTSNNSLSFYKSLDDILRGYNNSHHRTIGYIC